MTYIYLFCYKQRILTGITGAEDLIYMLKLVLFIYWYDLQKSWILRYAYVINAQF